MENDAIRTQDLSVGYDGRALIEHIQLHLHRGEIMTLIGPNGSGKSTILKSIIRQLELVAGTVYLEGRAMKELSPRQIAQKLSVLMTERVKPELMTCWDVVATGRYPYTGRLGILSRADREKVAESLALVHGQELADREFTQISDGQRQRVLLARALCQEPEIIVLDEPTSFLDIRHKLELLTILKQMVRQRQLAVLLSLHELDLAQKVSDTVVCVHNNAIEKVGPPEEIFTAEYVASLYGLERGSYNADFGSLELEPPRGEPRVFVIGGGGSGIPVYRQLQRRGIPFAAGVLHPNDLDYPVAKSLAAQVIEASAFSPIGEGELKEALAVLERCGQVCCPLDTFGAMNQDNLRLRQAAEAAGKLALASELC